MDTPTIATVVFPAREFEAGVNAWTTVFGTGPAFSCSGQQTAPGEADFAVFKTPDIEIALTSLPWIDEPLVEFVGDGVHGEHDPARVLAALRSSMPSGLSAKDESVPGGLVLRAHRVPSLGPPWLPSGLAG